MLPDAKADNEAFYAFKTTANPDTMYLHQARNQPDESSSRRPWLRK
jgi:hypothetical protein